jgi:menaquinone-dependent protoporphyrinogen IX oxidase
MNIAIIYDSRTGTTAKAAEAMGKTMEKHGHQCRVQSVEQADPAAQLTAGRCWRSNWHQA